MVGYGTDTEALIEADGDAIVLTDLEHYTYGSVRSRKEYLELTNIDPIAMTCGRMKWCNQGELE
jgi:hypothetical protein